MKSSATNSEALATAVVDTIKRAIEPLRKHNAELQARIEKLESRPLQKWAGVHVAGVQYAEASLVTKGGSLWAAMTTTTTTPGENNSDWRLIVKRGHA